MCNLNIDLGLVNNARVIIEHIPRRGNRIRIRTLGDHANVFFIPRTRFLFRPFGYESWQIRRTQFPLRRAYAFTYDKSQGQSLNKIILDVSDNAIFAHGQLYVGLSRIQHHSNIKLYLNDNQLQVSKYNPQIRTPTCINIVYKEIFDIMPNI